MTITIYECAGVWDRKGVHEPEAWSYATTSEALCVGGWLAQGAEAEIITMYEAPIGSPEADVAIRTTESWEINHAVSYGLLG